MHGRLRSGDVSKLKVGVEGMLTDHNSKSKASSACIFHCTARYRPYRHSHDCALHATHGHSSDLGKMLAVPSC